MARNSVVALFLVLAAMLVIAACEGEQGPAGPSGATGPAGPSVIIAFASVKGNVSGEVWNFGGAGTDSVEVTRNDVGDYEVRFHGNYADFTGKNDVTVLVTVEEGEQNHIASADFTIGGGSEQDGSEFWTNVLIYVTNTLEPADADFAVLVLRQ